MVNVEVHVGGGVFYAGLDRRLAQKENALQSITYKLNFQSTNARTRSLNAWVTAIGEFCVVHRPICRLGWC